MDDFPLTGNFDAMESDPAPQPDWEFVARVLETPLGVFEQDWEGADEREVRILSERTKIMARYNEIKWDMGFGEASRQARAEWLAAYMSQFRNGW